MATPILSLLRIFLDCLHSLPSSLVYLNISKDGSYDKMAILLEQPQTRATAVSLEGFSGHRLVPNPGVAD